MISISNSEIPSSKRHFLGQYEHTYIEKDNYEISYKSLCTKTVNLVKNDLTHNPQLVVRADIIIY